MERKIPHELNKTQKASSTLILPFMAGEGFEILMDQITITNQSPSTHFSDDIQIDTEK